MEWTFFWHFDQTLAYSVQLAARPSRHNQTQRQKSESVQANLRQYGLESQYLDVLVADASRPEIWRQQPLFDAIITDRETDVLIAFFNELNVWID